MLFGQRTLSCYLGKWNYVFPKCIRSAGCGKLRSPENGLMWPYDDGSMVGFMCYPGYTRFGSSSLVCLNGNWNASVPQCLKHGSLDCNFDSDEDPFCGWVQDATDTWQRVSYQSGGGYLTVPTTNTSSRIVSPLIKPSPDSQCFFFSRNLDRNTFLKIYIKTDKAFNEGYYSSTSTWENTTYILPPLDENYQLILQVHGLVGGHVQLDDFKMIDQESCSSISSMTTNRPLLSTYMQEIDDQSCRFRCTSSDALTLETDYFTSTVPIETTQPNGPVFIRCDCHPGCTETSTCCRDFDHYCIARETLKPQYANITSTTKKPSSEYRENTTTNPILKMTTAMIPITKDLNTISLQPVTKSNISSTTVSNPTQFKATTFKITPTTIKSTTIKPTTTSKKPTTTKTTTPAVRLTSTARTSIGTTRKTTSTKKMITITTLKPTKKYIPIPTKKVTQIINPSTSRKSTSTSIINPTTNSITKESFIPISLATLKATTKIINTTPTYNAKELTSKDNSLFSQTMLIIIILGSIGIISVIILVIWYVRRRRIYVSRGQLNHLSEDSDVRFLTGDEILDFTLQRPVPEDLDL